MGELRKSRLLNDLVLRQDKDANAVTGIMRVSRSGAG